MENKRTVNYEETIAEVARLSGLPTGTCTKVIDTYHDFIKEQMLCLKSVVHRRFGTFKPAKQKAKIARRVKENTAMPIPERYVPKFTASRKWKKEVEEYHNLPTL